MHTEVTVVKKYTKKMPFFLVSFKLSRHQKKGHRHTLGKLSIRVEIKQIYVPYFGKFFNPF